MGGTYLSPLRFLRFPDRPPLAHSRLVSSQHAWLDFALPGVPPCPPSPPGRPCCREPRAEASTRHPPAVEARPSSPHFVGPSPLGLRLSPLSRVAAESGHRQARDR